MTALADWIVNATQHAPGAVGGAVGAVQGGNPDVLSVLALVGVVAIVLWAVGR